jgi:hypothetical protein
MMKKLILQYEKDFFSKDFCNNRTNLESRLSQEFIEYGKSGYIYDRKNSINALLEISKDRDIEIMQFEITELCENVLLAHYISHHKDNNSYALRTSIWKIEDNTWKLYFHQGTPHRPE